MFDGLLIAALVGSCVKGIKEHFEPTIPAENWENKELIHQDKMNGISEKQFSKNLANGKYKMSMTYPEPHKDPVSGKIIIENDELYNEDVRAYGAYQAQQWAKLGKYNLTPEELEKKHEEFKKKMEHLYGLL